ncbi:MAG: hypothetical protein ACREYE_32760 [Gammaproteobacteria bacterium]
MTDQAPRGLVDVLETGDLTDGISVTTVGCDIILSTIPPGSFPTGSSMRPMAGSV